MPAADQDRMRQRHIETALEAIDVWYDPESGPYERTEGADLTEKAELSQDDVSRQVGVNVDDLTMCEQHIRFQPVHRAGQTTACSAESSADERRELSASRAWEFESVSPWSSASRP